MQSRAAITRAGGPSGFFSRAVSKAAAAAARNIRLTVILSLVLICGSFASAAAIQLRLDRSRALDQARTFESRRAEEIAADFAATLNRYTALGTAFANATGAETAATLSDAGGNALKNIVVLDKNGGVISQLKGAPQGLLPLAATVLTAAARARTVLPGTDGHSMAVLFPLASHLVAVQIDLQSLLRPAGMEEAVLATNAGRILDLGSRWQNAPSMDALNLGDARRATRIIDAGGESRLAGLVQVPGWPVVAGASIRVGQALSSWYGSLPLFLFFILGPAVAGAGLAVVFVREFERRTRTAEAVRNLLATPRQDARLLIRLADAERRAAEAERSKSEFIGHMSHELRTPLNAVIGFAEVIAQGIFGEAGHPKYVEYANDIAEAGRNLHAKIGDILDFANIEAGRHPVRVEEIDVAKIVRAVIDDMAGRAFSRRVKLTVSLIDRAPAMADALAVRRILANLIANALQFTPEGGAVRIEVRREQGAIVTHVRDSGLGFTREEKEAAGHAFTRFDRPGAVTGIGMGLAVAMALAHRMDGVVRLAGGPGQGTAAELRLPHAAPEQDAQR